MSGANGHAATPVRLGDVVRLNVPENVRLHGARGRVTSLRDWGAVVSTEAAATGQYRALFSELEPERTASGDVCDQCGGCNLIRDGKCLLCVDCGSGLGGCS